MKEQPTLTTPEGTFLVPDGVSIDPVKLGWKRVETGKDEPPVFVQKPDVLPQIPDNPAEVKTIQVAPQPLKEGAVRVRFPDGVAIDSVSVNGKRITLNGGSREEWYNGWFKDHTLLQPGDTLSVTINNQTYTGTVNRDEKALTLSTGADAGNPPTGDEVAFTGNETEVKVNPQDFR